MSGIVGIFHRDGTPVDRDQLLVMTDFLAYRGPDGQDTWLASEIGLGHTLLKTSPEPDNQNHPIRVESLWITADVHLDSKAELITKLRLTGRRIEGKACDTSLILHAYGAWGPECVEHLRGDFAFAIWDSKAKILFCARDHFGIKPFYYAEGRKAFIFSNTLNCIRQHPAVSSQVNEEAIGDFLLFGSNDNENTTSFRDIQRLPAAHWLRVSRDDFQTKRYWYPPTRGRVRYARSEDYVDNFLELFEAAVVDRLSLDRTGILLSGGLDSGTVAAVASAYSKGHGSPSLKSFTVGYDSLIPDREGYYARQSAERLGIPNEYLALDNIELFEKWDDVQRRNPEPANDPLYAKKIELYRRIAQHCRVVLSGEGPDNLMYFQMWPYIKDLRRHREWSRLVSETARFLWIRPLPWLGIAHRIQSFFGRSGGGGSRVPSWIAPDFAKRMRLEERCKERSRFLVHGPRHPVRPKAYRSMLGAQWSSFFESDDPGVTGYPVEVRYPFLDLRIVDYLLAIPVFPWAYKKKLLRNSMVNKLPDASRLRPKTPVLVDPVIAKIRQNGIKCLDNIRLSLRTAEFVNAKNLPESRITMTSEEIRAYILYRWLRTIK